MYEQLKRYIESLVITQGRHAGERFELLSWQKRFLRGVFGTAGDAALSLARGGGKTTFIAALGAAAVDVDCPLVEPRAETLIVASSFDQGLIDFRHLLAFMEPNMAADRSRWRVQDSANRATITDQVSRAMVRVVGSDPRRLHGAAPRLLIYDEVAQWPPEKLQRMLAALTTSRGKIPDSRALWIGTRPDSPDHPFQKVLDGHGVGFRLSFQARANDPPFQRRTWKRANPGLDHFPDLEAAIRQEAETARADPEQLAQFRALRLNQGVSDTVRSVLIDADTWKRIEVDESGMDGKYALGVDLGQNAAMSAAAAYWPETGSLEAIACFPEIPSLAERGLGDGVGNLYVRMHEAGDLIVAGRRVADIEDLLTECLERWGTPGVIVCDRWREAELREKLELIDFPMTTLEVRGQGFKDGGEDVRIFRKACAAGSVRPERSLLLRAALSEARVTGDPAGNWKLAKNTQGGRRSHARDDTAAAAILAVSGGMRRSKSTGAGQKVRAAVV